MPCASVGLPAVIACKTGGKLAQIPGSVCSDCYAAKGNYRFKNVKTPRAANLAEVEQALATEEAGAAWVDEMVLKIKDSGFAYFRWHDSGDIQSARHLELICQVCDFTPEVKHWLPTREYSMVQDVAYDRKIPENLNIRLSAHMIGRTLEPAGPFSTSSVDAGTGWQCPAAHNPANEGNCKSCRACWDKRVGNVDYAQH